MAISVGLRVARKLSFSWANMNPDFGKGPLESSDCHKMIKIDGGKMNIKVFNRSMVTF